MVGRGDRGGLGYLTRDVAAHLPVAAALVVDLTSGYSASDHAGARDFDRGPWDATAGEVRVCGYPPEPSDVLWLLDRSDVVYTAEVPYSPGLPTLAAEHDVEVVIHAMPELWKDEYRGPTTTVALPTGWHATDERFADAVSLPVPVDTDEFAWSPRSHAGTFLHVSASAFHDRNGTELVKAALPLIRNSVTVHTSGVIPAGEVVEQMGNVKLVHRGRADTAREVYSSEDDVLVQPRRFGGLSLTAQEAMALGMPLVCMEWDPYASHAAEVVRISRDPEFVQMAGGNLPVADADPAHLAAAIDALVDDPGTVEAHSRMARNWVVMHSWETLRPRWVEVLGL